MTDPLPSGPAPDGSDTSYWEGLRAGVLRLPRCSDCGTFRPVSRILCGTCHSFATSWDEVPARGTVFSWVRSHRAFLPELDEPTPYVTVLVQLPDVPVRLLGLFRGDETRIGDDVVGVIEDVANAAWPILRWRAA